MADGDAIRAALGLPPKEPPEDGKIVPAYSRANDVPKQIPLAPQVRANIRRIDREPAQLSWDAATDPQVMLAAVRDSGSTVLPVARFMEETKRMLDRATGGHAFAVVSQTMQHQTLFSSARLLHKGDVSGAIDFLMPIRRLLTPGASGDATGLERVRAALCEIIRALYPNAPVRWGVKTPLKDPTLETLPEHRPPLELPAPEEPTDD